MTEVTHHWEAGGLRLVMSAPTADGRVVTGTVSWGTRAEAESNYGNALASFAEKAAAFDAKIQPGTKRAMRRIVTRFGAFYPSYEIGPPTWWWPRVSVGRTRRGTYEVMVGWLRLAVALGFLPSDRSDADA